VERGSCCEVGSGAIGEISVDRRQLRGKRKWLLGATGDSIMPFPTVWFGEKSFKATEDGNRPGSTRGECKAKISSRGNPRTTDLRAKMKNLGDEESRTEMSKGPAAEGAIFLVRTLDP